MSDELFDLAPGRSPKLTEEAKATDTVTNGGNPVSEPVVQPVEAAAKPEATTTPTPNQANTPKSEGLPEFEAALRAKDVELTQLKVEFDKVKGSSDEASAARLELQKQIGLAIADKERIQAEQDAKLKAKDADLAKVAEATQSLDRKASELEVRLAEETAKRVKLEVLSKEFPHLMKYADFIGADGDPATVRKYCEAFATQRESDLDDYRVKLGGAKTMATVPTGTAPATRPLDVNNLEELESRLRQARKQGPNIFEAELEAAFRAWEAANPSR